MEQSRQKLLLLINNNTYEYGLFLTIPCNRERNLKKKTSVRVVTHHNTSGGKQIFIQIFGVVNGWKFVKSIPKKIHMFDFAMGNPHTIGNIDSVKSFCFFKIYSELDWMFRGATLSKLWPLSLRMVSPCKTLAFFPKSHKVGVCSKCNYNRCILFSPLKAYFCPLLFSLIPSFSYPHH